MSRIRKPTVATTVIGVALGVAGANSAIAGNPPVDTAVLQGSGTISPGLPGPNGPCLPEHWTFDGTLVIVGDDSLVGPVHYEADSATCDTDLFGTEIGNVSGSVSGSVTITRQGVVVTVAGSVTVGGEEHAVIAGNCSFTPTSFNPTNTYMLACQAVLSS